MKKIFSFVLIALILFPIALSYEYYADINMRLDEKGTSYMDGTTNYDAFRGTTEDYTSKKGEYWLLNITTNASFSDYYMAISFPKNTEINYIKVKGNFRIAEDSNLMLITSGKDEPVQIIVQYRVGPEASVDYLLITEIIGVILLISLSVFLLKSRRPKNKGKLGIIMHTLTDNQKIILKILQEAKEPITQKQLQHRTNFPKATLSRNLELLKQKNIIVKQSRGLMNVIMINEEFRK